MVLNLDRQEMAGAQLAKWDYVRFDFVFRFLHSRTDFVSYFSCHSLSLSLSHSAFAMFIL